MLVPCTMTDGKPDNRCSTPVQEACSSVGLKNSQGDHHLNNALFSPGNSIRYLVATVRSDRSVEQNAR